MAKYLSRVPLLAHKSSVPSSQADVEIYEITSPVVGLIKEIQFYCTAITATASACVKKDGTKITGDVTPVAGTPSIESPTDPFVNQGDALTVHATTDATGTFTDLSVSIIVKQQESISRI